jgi:hypothetical protein
MFLLLLLLFNVNVVQLNACREADEGSDVRRKQNRHVGWDCTRSVSLVSRCHFFSIESLRHHCDVQMMKQGTKRVFSYGQVSRPIATSL